jgi:hypothetical protein
MSTPASGTSSLRQLARLIGVSEKAVRKAKAAGVFSPESMGREAGGAPVVLDLNLAVREWERSGRKLRGTRRPVATEPSAQNSQLTASDVPALGDDGAELDDEADAGELPVGLPASLVDAQRITMIERARKLRLENDLREGQLLELAAATREAFEFARVLRESVLNIPARLSAELAAEPDAGRVYLRLDGALREALEATATTLEAAVNG